MHQALFLQGLEHAADHLAGAADDAADFLTGDLDLHAVRMRHGVRLLAQVQQGAGHAAGNVEESQVAHLARGIAQAIGHLAAQGVENLRVLLGQFTELGVAQFRHLALGLGADPGAAFLLGAFLLEQAHLAEEVAGVEVGDDHLAAVVILDEDGDRAFDDEEQGFATIPCIDDGAFGRVAAAVTMREQFVDVLDLRCKGNSDHARVPKIRVSLCPAGEFLISYPNKCASYPGSA